MKSKERKSGLSRRKFLPLFGGTLLLPFLTSAKSVNKIIDSEEEYETALTKDGKAVKVRKGVLNSSTTVESKLSNKSLLKWLKKDQESK